MTAAQGLVLVARIGKPHGLRGEVTVQLHTDDPDRRLAVNATLICEPLDHGPLTIATVRVHQGRHLVGFESVSDREGAEALRHTRLYVPALDPSGRRSHFGDAPSQDVDEFYEDELVGMSVVLTTGEAVGTVSALHTRAAQDLLEIAQSEGGTALVPFVAALVPRVDSERREVVIDPPEGLLGMSD